MKKITIPGQHINVDTPSGVDPLWYQVLKQLEPLTTEGVAAAASLLGNPTGVSGPNVAIPLAAGLSFVGGALQGSSIDGVNGAFTFDYGLARTAQALRASLTSAFAALGANVPLNSTGTYFNGPSLTLGTGTWFVTGTVSLIDTAATAEIYSKLWDGTTVMASCAYVSNNTLRASAVSLSGIITNPVGNVRISCRDIDATTGLILSNHTGNSKDSHITAIRIA